MKRIEASNILLASVGLISALHTALFGIWVSSVSSKLMNLSNGISLFGIVFISLNIIFWWLARYRFQKEIVNTEGETPLNNWLSTGLISPFLLILIGWIVCYFNYDVLSLSVAK